MRALRSAHHMVMDWLRFSLLTRGFFREPEAELFAESSYGLLYWLNGVVFM